MEANESSGAVRSSVRESPPVGAVLLYGSRTICPEESALLMLWCYGQWPSNCGDVSVSPKKAAEGSIRVEVPGGVY